MDYYIYDLLKTNSVRFPVCFNITKAESNTNSPTYDYRSYTHVKWLNMMPCNIHLAWLCMCNHGSDNNKVSVTLKSYTTALRFLYAVSYTNGMAYSREYSHMSVVFHSFLVRAWCRHNVGEREILKVVTSDVVLELVRAAVQKWVKLLTLNLLPTVYIRLNFPETNQMSSIKTEKHC